MKKINYLAVCGLLCATALGFTGCSDDDNEGGGTPNNNNSFITTEDGDKLLVTKAGNYTLSYNAEGLLTQAYDGNDNLYISYNPNKLNSPNGDIEDYDFSLNSAGYISAISGSYEDSGDGYSEKGSGSTSFSYDGNGNLTGITTNSSYSGSEDGEGFSGSETTTSVFTWTNGNLTKVVSTYYYTEDGETESGTDIYTLTYGNNAHENTLGQFSCSLASAYEDANFPAICFAGYFGKPSKQFPTNVKCVDENDRADFSVNATYTFNNNGTLASENNNYTTYSYSYSNAPTAVAKVAAMFAPKNNQKSHKLFRSHRKK